MRKSVEDVPIGAGQCTTLASFLANSLWDLVTANPFSTISSGIKKLAE